MRIEPDFFGHFRCKASECCHTCCAGWEIAVDDDTLVRCESVLTQSEKRKLISSPDGILLCEEGKRCGFLRNDGLCELIISHGEDILCDICREHPRFYSYSENGGICEAGVGLCCEEAARLWLENDLAFVEADDEYQPDADEFRMLEAQKALMRKALDGDLPRLDFDELVKVYQKMETLEPLSFSAPDGFDFSDRKARNLAARNLALYYIYRWYFEYPDEVELFAAANVLMTAALGGDFIDSARKLSCEVEYDPDNTEMIIDYLKKVRTERRAVKTAGR